MLKKILVILGLILALGIGSIAPALQALVGIGMGLSIIAAVGVFELINNS